MKEYRRAIDSGKSRETGNIGYTRRRQTKQKHNTVCVGHHYTQANTNNVNKTLVPYKQLEVQTKRISFVCGNRNGCHNAKREDI